ncbi:MAG: ATP-binding protein [Candidatus Latescibacterota bacterium]|nr:ATP-binding protein [Candidatus Latescibacterota bacterium]
MGTSSDKGSERDRELDAKEAEAFTTSYVAFNEALAKLETSHNSLEQHFDTLNKELEETNKQLQKSLEDKEHLTAYLQNILESLGTGVIAVGPDNQITHCNAAAAEILGYDVETILGRGAERALGDASALLELTVQTGQSIDQERALTTSEGSEVPVRFKTACLADADGAIIGGLSIIEDMTQIRELTDQANRVSTLTALGEMSATVAHEIRNPLGGIGGFAEVLIRKLEQEDPRRQLVTRIIEGIDRLNSVVSNLLNYTRPTQLTTRPVNFVEVIEDCLGFFEIDAGARAEEIEIQRQYESEEIICHVDPEQIQQIVLNLLHNAVQAIPGTGWIRTSINTCSDGEPLESGITPPYLIFSVADSGMGMNEEIRSKLFRPFFTTKEDGNGLGLATAKKIIEAHGGAMLVESDLGKGTRFDVIVPLT